MDFDDLLAPSGTTFKYKSVMNVGDTIQGILLAKPEVSPHLDFKTKEQRKSSRGNLLWQLKVQVQVSEEFQVEHLTKSDSVTLYLTDAAYFAAVKAFRDLGSKEFRGMIFGMKRLEDEPSKTVGFADRKGYAVKVALPKGE